MKSHLKQLRDILAMIENKPGFEENAELIRDLIHKEELSDMIDNTYRIDCEMGKGHLVEADLRRLKREIWALDNRVEDEDE